MGVYNMGRLCGPKRIAGVMALEEVCILTASVDKKPHGEQGTCNIFLFFLLSHHLHSYPTLETHYRLSICHTSQTSASVSRTRGLEAPCASWLSEVLIAPSLCFFDHASGIRFLRGFAFVSAA